MSKYDRYNKKNLFFSSKSEFKQNLRILKNAGCKKIESDDFYKSDQYDNEGLCYRFNAKLLQRLDRYTGLAVSDETWHVGRRTFKGTDTVIFVKFKKSWKEDARKFGVIKGLGSYRYNTMNGSRKNISKGQVLIAY